MNRERLIAGGLHDNMSDLDLLNIIEGGMAQVEANRLNAYGAYGFRDWTEEEVLIAANWAFVTKTTGKEPS